MKNIFLIIMVSLFSLNGTAQDLVKEFSTLLLELESNVSGKVFLKAWKKQKKTWESDVQSATTVKQVSSLTVAFVNKVYEVKMLKTMVIITNNLADQCTSLTNVYNTLKIADLEGWKGAKAWESSLKELTVKIKKQQEKEAAKERALFIKSTMQGFESTFKTLFEDSKKGSFANTVEGAKNGNEFAVKVKFKAGENQKIVVDGDNIYEFQVDFKTNNDPLLASALQEAMLKIIAANVPEGFPKSNKYDNTLVNGGGYRFEFKAEKFNITAKQPSVVIGTKKADNSVVLRISEPVFKR